MSDDPQLGQTSASRSRSAAIKFSASEARYSLMPRRPTADPSRGPAAGAVASRPRSSNLRPVRDPGKRLTNISRRRGTLVLALGMVLLASPPLAAQRPVVVRLSAAADGSPRMEPDRVSVRPGDVVRFRVFGGAPHAIGMLSKGLDPRVAAAWNRAFTDRVGALRGPLLLQVGAEYAIVIPNVPDGTYRLFCTTHRAYRSSHVDLVVKRRQ